LLEFPAILASAYHDSGRYTEAISAAEASLALRANDVDPILILTAAHAAQGGLEQARNTAKQVIEIAPSFRLGEFAKTLPYQDPSDLNRLIDRLRDTGLPD
jgi:tetratricopeptide (TPR) repeat protein